MKMSNQKGYTLITVLMTIIIFFILALVLSQATATGTKHTKQREDEIQAKYLAKMGMDYFFTHFITEMKSLENLDSSEYDRQINEFLAAYNTSTGKTFTTKNGTYTIKIVERKKNNTGNPEDLSEDIVVKSTGVVNMKTKNLQNTYHLGAKQTPDALKYALSAYGNVFLHGAVSVIGDLYVGENLITSPYTTYSYGIEGRTWKESDLPSVDGFPNEQASLVVGNKIYTMDEQPKGGENWYNQHKYYTTFNKPLYYNRSYYYYTDQHRTVEKAFKKGHAPTLQSYQPTFTPINIKEQKDLLFSNAKPLEKKKINDDFDAEQGYIRKGDLTITTDGKNRSPIYIKGPMYIDGDLKISFANVKFDSVIYVDGNVEIRDATIKKLQNGSLILFATGDIQLYNNNENDKIPDTIDDPYHNPDALRMYLYSDRQLEIYGIGSNIQIDGGIFAKRIVLNATKGNTAEDGKVLSFEKNQKQIPPERSRLRIVYNKELIQNPTEGLPKVKGIDLILKERQ